MFLLVSNTEGMNTKIESCQSLTTFHVDDLPLLIGIIRSMNLDCILDDIVPTHGNTLRQNELTNGEALCVWLVYLMCESSHRKWKVADWVACHTALLTRLWGAPVLASDFSDDRLSTLWAYLARAPLQDAIDQRLCASTISLYHLQQTHVRLDATVLTGYQHVTENGVMQAGFVKGAGPLGDSQCKLMAAATSTGQYLTGHCHPGDRADDPLYVPLLSRLFRWDLPPGMLFVGDSKMGALATRRHIVAHQHHYYMPLSDSLTPPAEYQALLTEALAGSLDRFTAFAPIFRDEELLGYGYAFTRSQDVATVRWTEQVHVIRSLAMVTSERKTLDRHVEKARHAFHLLQAAPKKGVKVYPDEASLQAAILAIGHHGAVAELFHVTTAWNATYQTAKYQGRMEVTAVQFDEAAYQRRVHRCGWRLYVTSAPAERVGMETGFLLYRQGAGQGIERMNHLVKDQDTLGLNRLYVSNTQQIRGLCYFVTLAQRMSLYMESTIRASLAETGEELPDYAPGQKGSTRPTTKTMLERLGLRGVTLTDIVLRSGQQIRHLSDLPRILKHMLRHLHLSEDIYQQLLE